MNPNHAHLKSALQADAVALEFDVMGVAPVDVGLRREYYERWIAEGRHGSMAWMARNNDRRLDPARLIASADGTPQARSLIVVGVNYFQQEPARRYRIAKYALGRDYHNVLLKRLKKLCTRLREHGGAQRPYVDTGPILEKALAARAGLGWQGKSTILLHPQLGTWMALGVIVTTLELPADTPMPDRCGSCTVCQDACPTAAITAPYQLDARRCLAYLLIEHPGEIPEEFRAAVGNRLFGCDECLDVCPWNKWARTTREAAFTARDYPDLRVMLGWTEEDYRQHTQGTPLARLKLSRLKRNACVVLGNIGGAEDGPVLERLAGETDPMIAEHARWAVRQLLKRGIATR